MNNKNNTQNTTANNNNNTPTSKFTRTYEDEDTIETWTFDLDKFKRGPVQVDIKWKNGLDKPKNWNKRLKDAKNERRVERQMKKIDENTRVKATSTRGSKRGRPRK
jgi:hypothetical protein